MLFRVFQEIATIAEKETGAAFEVQNFVYWLLFRNCNVMQCNAVQHVFRFDEGTRGILMGGNRV